MIKKYHSGYLNLSGRTDITSLPEGLTVVWWLDLEGCTGLTSLPDGLTVGRSLIMKGCTGLTSLSDGMTVGGGLYLIGCTGLKFPLRASQHSRAGWALATHSWHTLMAHDDGTVTAGCRDFSNINVALTHWRTREGNEERAELFIKALKEFKND